MAGGEAPWLSTPPRSPTWYGSSAKVWRGISGNPDDEQVRDGLIQRFEFIYELSHKMLRRRYLTQIAASPDDITAMPFADLGNAQRLLRGDWPVWCRFREMRSRTSHTYDVRIASEVVTALPEFLAEAEYLLTQLQGQVG